MTGTGANLQFPNELPSPTLTAPISKSTPASHCTNTRIKYINTNTQIQMSFHLQILRLPSQHQHFELRSQRHTTWSSKHWAMGNGTISKVKQVFQDLYVTLSRKSFGIMSCWAQGDLFKSPTTRKIFSWEAVEGFYAIGRAEWFLMGGVHGWQTYSNVFWSNKQFGI